MSTDQQIIHGLRSRVFETLGRDNNVIETPDEQCIEAADRMAHLVAIRDAAQRLMDYFEHSLGAGPLTNNPGKEAAYIRLLREALATPPRSQP